MTRPAETRKPDSRQPKEERPVAGLRRIYVPSLGANRNAYTSSAAPTSSGIVPDR